MRERSTRREVQRRVAESNPVMGVDGYPVYDPDIKEHLWARGVFKQVFPDLGHWGCTTDDKRVVMRTAPGCLFCMQEWSPEVGESACPGEPDAGGPEPRRNG